MARYGGGRPTAEGSLTLNLYKLMRDGMCAPRKYGSGALHWPANGIRTGSMGFESALGDDRGFLSDCATRQRSGTGRSTLPTIELSLQRHRSRSVASDGGLSIRKPALLCGSYIFRAVRSHSLHGSIID
jgi:hypothetical protein